jgi:translation initiation factor 2D
VSYFTTWPLVLEKLQSGADLMLPGIVLKSSDLNELGSFPKGRVTGINLVGNKSAVGVGVTAVSSTGIAMNGMRGKGVVVLHVYQDYLWEMGKKVLIPHIPDDKETTDTEFSLDAIQLDSDAEQPSDTVKLSQEVSFANETEEEQHSSVQTTATNDADEAEEPIFAPGSREDGQMNSSLAACDIDSLLVWCFLCALQSKVQKSDLPLLTSTLYSDLMQQCCPAGADLDVKKTKYKKVSCYRNS